MVLVVFSGRDRSFHLFQFLLAALACTQALHASFPAFASGSVVKNSPEFPLGRTCNIRIPELKVPAEGRRSADTSLSYSMTPVEAMKRKEQRRRKVIPRKMGCVDTVADPLVFRNYNPSMDHSDLMRLCHLEWDYVPRVIETFCASSIDHPFVLESPDADKIVSFGNVQQMSSEVTWIQAIRVDPNYEGRGFGTEILSQLIALSRDLGASKALSSTSKTNHAMLHIFKKLGFRFCNDIAYYPDSNSMLAIKESKPEADLLVELGLERMLPAWRQEASKFQTCRSPAELMNLMKMVEEEARAKNINLAPMVSAEYRIYHPQQGEILSSISDNRCWVKYPDGEEGSEDRRGAALLLLRRSREMKGRYIACLTTADESAVGAALTLINDLVGREGFQLYFNDIIPAASHVRSLFGEKMGSYKLVEIDL
uniref:N-acetyltransferase domain-containing protein n=1 Tax=Guillardia theta TaxID=55529 RepID=A0A7S4M199_GUITH|mmetsp:Transcript_13032/g.45826  ORF Transcript_13032/g.45826 Transcript_13032/m.45826 type:complete len:425 (+) Transcript_13032:195-1469(+)